MYEWLFGYANAVLSDPSRAEEAVQETFRIACDKLSALLESENPKGWLVNTLKGVLRNTLRKDTRESKVFAPMPEQYDGQQQEQLPLSLLYQDLAETKEYRLLQQLNEFGSVRALAQHLGISEATCKKRIQRARDYLKKKMTN
jgi:RNA polymerase sigma-70 factor (ECF subfamily)